jgi:hypothetical protein
VDAWSKAKVGMGILLRLKNSGDDWAIVVIRAPDAVANATHLGFEPSLLQARKRGAEP